MPTYTVHAPAGRLSAAQKERVACAITRVHDQVTGAQGFFAQVMFVEVRAGNWFVGGAPLAGEQVFIHGQIRAGRSSNVKKELLTKLLEAVSGAASFDRNRMWGYIAELPPSQMAEYGHVLPEPGTEAQWLAGLPDADKALMETIGKYSVVPRKQCESGDPATFDDAGFPPSRERRGDDV